MSLLSVDELKQLVEEPEGTCVSIYMPLYRVVPEVQQNSIRLKNLMKEAEEKLVAYGMDSQEALDLLAPVKVEIDSDDFWAHLNDGLAIFVAPGIFRSYRLPAKFNELVVVGDRFHLKPLMPFLMGDGLFYILALSQKRVRLIECTRYSASEVEVPNLPQDLDEALLYDETAKDGQFRISTPKGGTSNPFQQPGTFHGQGSPDRDEMKQQSILQYFHLVDKAVSEYLHDKKAPLVLAGVEYLHPIYRETNEYPHLVSEGIAGNPELRKPEELQEEALPIVEPLFAQAIQQAGDRYKELAAAGKASHDVKEAVPAAYYGRVDELFVAVGVQQWGHFDPETSTVQMHPDEEAGDEDLLNLAAVQTILNGGTVYAVKPEEVPDKAAIAAVFRY